MKETTNRSNFIPEGWSSITPRIVAHDAKHLVEFLKKVFGNRATPGKSPRIEVFNERISEPD